MFRPEMANRRDLFKGGVDNILTKAAGALDINNPLAFLGLERSYTRLTRTSMYTDFQVLYGSYEPAKMQKAGMEILDEIDRFEEILNIWRTGSELETVNQNAAKEPVAVCPELFEMVRLAKMYHARTEGAFDITATPLVKLWGFFNRSTRIPDPQEIDETLKKVGMDHVILDPAKRTIYFDVEGIEITPASMGKGFALDHAIRVAHGHELKNVLLNGGFSSVLASGSPAWKDYWQFDIPNPNNKEKPLAIVKLRNKGFSTSGSEFQHFEHEGKTYGHILDPRFGWPVNHVFSINVIAPTAAEAEILSTAFYVMGVEKTLKYCENYPNIGVVILCLPDSMGKYEILTANINEDVVEVMYASC